MPSLDDIPVTSVQISARKEMLRIARAMLIGNFSYIEGADQLVPLANRAGVRDDKDVLVFIVIESETDAFPLERVRHLWSPTALAKLQPKIEKAERWAREVGEPECRSLVERLQRAEELTTARNDVEAHEE